MNATARILSAALATAALAGLPAPQPAQASTALQRCTTSDGGEIYTDKACAAFGAQSAPIPAPMMTRLARTFTEDADGEQAVAMVETAAIPASRRSAASGCARTPRQLEADLRGSLALGDVNRIAESYHWVGVSSDDSKRILARLESMATEQVRDTHYFDASIAVGSYANLYADASGATPQPAGNAGTMQLQLGKASIRVVDLSVQKYAGCYFVKF
ncbi:hypothetical protein [Luteimonas vadosa]|uniref:DUF4124 domain-containing protein n=1 Tax=Luteimonas vadosa TaxID=1165507 RepID=A0ABP9E1E4_9GAMM